MPQVTLSEETYGLLQAIAQPFMDKEPEDVIRRLIEERASGDVGGKGQDEPRNVIRRPGAELESRLQRGKGGVGKSAANGRTSAELANRSPRQRGVTVEIADHLIEAISVPDLYEQALQVLARKVPKQLREIIPYRTGPQRYLIADRPEHPNGRPFFREVKHNGYYMETHWQYVSAVSYLERLVERLGLSFRCLG